MFGPEASYEREGDVGNVAFPCGTTVAPDGDTIRMYYGGADTCIALATGSIRECLRWLEVNGSTPASIGPLAPKLRSARSERGLGTPARAGESQQPSSALTEA